MDPAYLAAGVALLGVLYWLWTWWVRNKSMKTTSVLPETFIVVDTETTGLHPDRHEIIEIAAIKVKRGSDQHQALTALVKPQNKIPAKITSITGITQKMIDRDGEDPIAVINEFVDFFENYRLVFYNAPFDLAFLNAAAERAGRSIGNPVSDALLMARQAFPGRTSYRLTDLARDGGLSTNNAHRALKDCEMTAIVYAGAAAELGRVDPRPSGKGAYPASIKSTRGSANGHLIGENAVFTGSLSMSRTEAAALAVDAGCAVASGVSKKTTLLIVGSQDASLLSGYKKSSKQRKAEEINQKMVDLGGLPAIRIIAETEFLDLINSKGS